MAVAIWAGDMVVKEALHKNHVYTGLRGRSKLNRRRVPETLIHTLSNELIDEGQY